MIQIFNPIHIVQLNTALVSKFTTIGIKMGEKKNHNFAMFFARFVEWLKEVLVGVREIIKLKMEIFEI